MSFDKTSSVHFCVKAWETEIHTYQINNIVYVQNVKRMSSEENHWEHLVNEMLTSDNNKFLSNIIS